MKTKLSYGDSCVPTDPIRLLKFCQEIEETPHDRLREMDRETLLGVRASLLELKRQVDRSTAQTVVC